MNHSSAASLIAVLQSRADPADDQYEDWRYTLAQCCESLCNLGDVDALERLVRRIVTSDGMREALLEEIFLDEVDEFLSHIDDISGMGNNELSEWQGDADEAMSHHLAGDHPLPYSTWQKIEYDPAGNGDKSHSMRVTMGFRDPRSDLGYRTWDTWSGALEYPGIATLLCAAIRVKGDECTVLPVAPRVEREPPLFRYFPERYRATRGYVKELAAQVSGSGLMNVVEYESVLARIMQGYNDELSQAPIRGAPASVGMTIINNELSLIEAHRRFVGSGSQIFDLPPAMVRLFHDTDIEDIPMDMIVTPYAGQYLHWGTGDWKFEVEEGRFIEGCYVHWDEQNQMLGFCLVASAKDMRQAREWVLCGEPISVQSFHGDTLHMGAGQALDQLYSNRQAQLEEEKTTGHQSFEQQASVLGKEGLIPGAETTRVVTRQRAQREQEQTQQRQEAVMGAMKMGINALCYLTMYQQDRTSTWPEGAPAKLVAKAESGQPKEARRAKSKLASLGYTAVTICGLNLPDTQSANRSQDESNDQRRLHWRRGHWRRQRFGPGRAQQKLIWVMPTLVGKHQDGQEPLGHLYLVQ
ncbi:MAG: hypothetical protein RJQ08_11070 [Salinisphaeraceae bacterium]